MGFAASSSAQRGGRSTAGGGASAGPLGTASTGYGTAGNKYEDYIYGVVKQLNKDAMVLTKTQYGKTQFGVDPTFKFNKKTKFIHDGNDSSLASLRLGDKVWVDAREDKKSGDLIARKVITGVLVMK